MLAQLLLYRRANGFIFPKAVEQRSQPIVRAVLGAHCRTERLRQCDAMRPRPVLHWIEKVCAPGDHVGHEEQCELPVGQALPVAVWGPEDPIDDDVYLQANQPCDEQRDIVDALSGYRRSLVGIRGTLQHHAVHVTRFPRFASRA